MAYSIQRDVSNGSLQYLEVRIDYFAKEHLSVYIAEKIVPQGTTPDPTSGYCWTWDGNRIKFNKAVANGLEVMVRRATPIAVPFHIFRQGAVFKDLTVDENFLQQLYINQENQEGQTTTDFYSDLNFHGYRLRNVGAALHDYDAVPFSQYRADAAGAMQQRILSEAAYTNAQRAADASNASALNASASASIAQGAATSADASKTAASASATLAGTHKDAAGVSANAASNSANASATSAAESKTDADRSKYWADRVDVNNINTQLAAIIAVNTQQQAALESAIGEITFYQLAGAVPSNRLPLSGGLYNRADYPLLWAMVQARKVPVVTEANWTGTNVASFTEGNGTTTFRVPHFAGLVLRQWSANAAAVGIVQNDAIRNITGTMTNVLGMDDAGSVSMSGAGAFGGVAVSYTTASRAGTGAIEDAYTFNFDASRVVPTANENRMINTAGQWVVRAKV